MMNRQQAILAALEVAAAVPAVRTLGDALLKVSRKGMTEPVDSAARAKEADILAGLGAATVTPTALMLADMLRMKDRSGL